jgi:hypothetical protein
MSNQTGTSTRGRPPSLEGYSNSLPKEVAAKILIDHCEHGKLGKSTLYEGQRTKCSEKFRSFTKLQKNNSKAYYDLLSEARRYLAELEATEEVESKKKTPKEKKKTKKKKKKKIKKASDSDDDLNYIPSDENCKPDDDNAASDLLAVRPKPVLQLRPTNLTTLSSPRRATKNQATPNAPILTMSASAARSNSAPIVSSPDIEIQAKDVSSLVPHDVVIYENIFITKPYYKYEIEADNSQYKRLYYAVCVFGLTQEDAKALKVYFPSGDRKVRLECPNVTSNFETNLESFSQELFRHSPEAEEAVRETVLSNVFKWKKIIDIIFPINLLQNISSRFIPVVRENNSSGHCCSCGWNTKSVVVANVFEVAGNARTQIGQEDMSSLIRDVHIGPNPNTISRPNNSARPTGTPSQSTPSRGVNYSSPSRGYYSQHDVSPVHGHYNYVQHDAFGPSTTYGDQPSEYP